MSNKIFLDTVYLLVLDHLLGSPVWVDGILPDLCIGQLGQNVIPKFGRRGGLANDPSALQWHRHAGFTIPFAHLSSSICHWLWGLLGFGFLGWPGCGEARPIAPLLAVDGSRFVKRWECFLNLLEIGRRRWLRPSRFHTSGVHHFHQGIVMVLAIVQNVNLFSAGLLHDLVMALLLHSTASIRFSGMDKDTPLRHQTVSGDHRVPSPLGSANIVCFLQPSFFETSLVQGLLFQKVGHLNVQRATIGATAKGQRVEQAVAVALHLDDRQRGWSLVSCKSRGKRGMCLYSFSWQALKSR